MTIKQIFSTLSKILIPTVHKPPYFHICQIGDPVLRQKAKAVSKEEILEPEISEILKQMKIVMKKYDTVGISAPQIGVPLRIIMVEFGEKHKKIFSKDVFKIREMSLIPHMTFINPRLEIMNYDKVFLPEGCESVKGYSAVVPRYREVMIKGLNEQGENVELRTKGWTSRIIQHEMDHIDGKLYIDIMDHMTFQNDGWQRINANNGRVKIEFHNK